MTNLPRTADLLPRYRIIAGPYLPHEDKMLANCLRDLRGCRAQVAIGTRGYEVLRLKNECESGEETARRLNKPIPSQDIDSQPDDDD